MKSMLLGLSLGLGVALASLAPAQAAESVYELSFANLERSPAPLERYRGRLLLLNFWATWCPPCIEEMPAMNTAWEALEPAGVGMLAINVGETLAAIEAFLEKVPIDFPILLGDGARPLPDWRARALPTTLVVDASGRIVYEAVGPRDWDDAELIRRLAALGDG